MWAFVVNIFWPLMTHSSPSRTARVVAAATSEPASGSVKPSTMMISPASAFGMICLLLVGADRPQDRGHHDRRADAVGGRVADAQLLVQRQHLERDRGPARPSSTGQPGASQPCSASALVKPSSLETPVRYMRSSSSGGHVLVEELADLGAELLGLVTQSEVHHRATPPAPTGRQPAASAVATVGDPPVGAAGVHQHPSPRPAHRR